MVEGLNNIKKSGYGFLTEMSDNPLLAMFRFMFGPGIYFLKHTVEKKQLTYIKIQSTLLMLQVWREWYGIPFGFAYPRRICVYKCVTFTVFKKRDTLAQNPCAYSRHALDQQCGCVIYCNVLVVQFLFWNRNIAMQISVIDKQIANDIKLYGPFLVCSQG